MEEKQEDRKRTRIIIIIQSALNVILLVLLGFFIYNYFTTDKKLVVTEEKLYSTDSARVELGRLLKETGQELDQYKGRNAQLDAFLQQKNDSLQEYAERIEALLRQGKVNREQLNNALEELDQLRYYKNKYLAQIDSLSTVIVSLNNENTTLRADVGKVKRKNEDLSMENTRLNNKVSIGSRLTTQNLSVTGIRIRGNGKEKETLRASQLEQLKVSFIIGENYVAEKGPKDIFLKVIGPDGTTVYNELAGSGTFKFQNEESLYSTKKTIEFEQDTQQVYMYWNKGGDYAKGKYKAELYSDGFKIGTADFQLK
jgi:regulator of replication initiation timing